MNADSPADVRLTDTQLGILAALCRPIAGGNHFATPATNQEIAEEVFLSVDAVKGHLRTLYRKFGIEDLAHNQKRARLVELAIEGGYVGSAAEKAEVRPRPMTVAEQARAARGSDEGGSRRPIGPYVTAAILILVVIGGTLSISGIFNQSSPAPAAPTAAAYRTEVAGYCKLALAGAPAASVGDRTERARGYLEVIETMRGRLESLVPPAAPDIALERFGVGLTNAANYTSDVAESPPPPGSPAEAKDVAELTFAAGQVQAGAVGYELGHECLAIGDLVAASAQNAAAP
jgi:hypothetical protein